MTDHRDDARDDTSRREMPDRRVRRPYASPELVEYGTVAKLTQSGGGSVTDFGPFMRMMVCL